MRKYLNLRTNIALGLIIAFLVNTFGPLPTAHADEFVLPKPGVMVSLSPVYNPAVLKGIKLDPQNPFRFHFFVDAGDDGSSQHSTVIPAKAGIQNQEQLKQESTKLIKYFLASLTIPEKDLWVNLSPYEKDRIVPQEFGQTQMGRDLLAEDYILKQITASLIYPESKLGKEFWTKVYAQAQAKYGTTNIPINTFNKVWIIPEKAVVYENSGTAFVLENHLKVMLDQDYLSLEKHIDIQKHAVILSAAKDLSRINSFRDSSATSQNDVNALGSQIIREIVIPAITKEVNEGKNFAQLRQVFYSLILATWYKKKIKDSILNQVYSDRKKTQNLSSPNALIGDPQRIYQLYLKAFKKGVYNYIKEDPDPITNQVIPRKYFSGGVEGEHIDSAIEDRNLVEINHSQMESLEGLTDVETDVSMTSNTSTDTAMDADADKEARIWARLGDIDQAGWDEILEGSFLSKSVEPEDLNSVETAVSERNRVQPFRSKQEFLIFLNDEVTVPGFGKPKPGKVPPLKIWLADAVGKFLAERERQSDELTQRGPSLMDQEPAFFLRTLLKFYGVDLYVPEKAKRAGIWSYDLQLTAEERQIFQDNHIMPVYADGKSHHPTTMRIIFKDDKPVIFISDKLEWEQFPQDVQEDNLKRLGIGSIKLAQRQKGLALGYAAFPIITDDDRLLFEEAQDWDQKRTNASATIYSENLIAYDDKEKMVLFQKTYPPSNPSSQLLLMGIRPKKNAYVRVIGTGAGSDAIAAVEKSDGTAEVLASDIDLAGVLTTRFNADRSPFKSKIHVVKGNLFEIQGDVPAYLLNRKADYIYFNMPLPPLANPKAGEEIDLAKIDIGGELFKRVLLEAPEHLADGGSLEITYMDDPSAIFQILDSGWDIAVVEGIKFTRETFGINTELSDYVRFTLVRPSPQEEENLESVKEQWQEIVRIEGILDSGGQLSVEEKGFLERLAATTSSFHEQLLSKAAQAVLFKEREGIQGRLLKASGSQSELLASLAAREKWVKERKDVPDQIVNDAYRNQIFDEAMNTELDPLLEHLSSPDDKARLTAARSILHLDLDPQVESVELLRNFIKPAGIEEDNSNIVLEAKRRANAKKASLRILNDLLHDLGNPAVQQHIKQALMQELNSQNSTTEDLNSIGLVRALLFIVGIIKKTGGDYDPGLFVDYQKSFPELSDLGLIRELFDDSYQPERRSEKIAVAGINNTIDVEHETIVPQFKGENPLEDVIRRIKIDDAAFPISQMGFYYDPTGQITRLEVDVNKEGDSRAVDFRVPLEGTRSLHIQYENGVPYISLEEEGKQPWLMSGFEYNEYTVSGPDHLIEKVQHEYVTIAAYESGVEAFESSGHESVVDLVKGVLEKNGIKPEEVEMDNRDLHGDNSYAVDEEPNTWSAETPKRVLAEWNWARYLKKVMKIGWIAWYVPSWWDLEEGFVKAAFKEDVIDLIRWKTAVYSLANLEPGSDVKFRINTVDFDSSSSVHLPEHHNPTRAEVMQMVNEDRENSDERANEVKLLALNFNRSDGQGVSGISYSDPRLSNFILNALVNAYAISLGKPKLQKKPYGERFEYGDEAMSSGSTDQALVSKIPQKLEAFWDRTKNVNRVQRLEEASTQFFAGRFPRGFRFYSRDDQGGERWYKPGQSAVGINEENAIGESILIGDAKEGDTIEVRRDMTGGIERIIFERWREGSIFRSAVYVEQKDGTWAYKGNDEISKFWFKQTNKIKEARKYIGSGFFDGQFPKGFILGNGSGPGQNVEGIPIGIGIGRVGDEVEMERVTTGGVERIIFRRWRDGKVFRSAVWHEKEDGTWEDKGNEEDSEFWLGLRKRMKIEAGFGFINGMFPGWFRFDGGGYRPTERMGVGVGTLEERNRGGSIWMEWGEDMKHVIIERRDENNRVLKMVAWVKTPDKLHGNNIWVKKKISVIKIQEERLADAAMNVSHHGAQGDGGIDLNPVQMNMQVRQEGEDFKFDFNGTTIDAAQVAGVTFTIRQMTPVTDLPALLGVAA